MNRLYTILTGLGLLTTTTCTVMQISTDKPFIHNGRACEEGVKDAKKGK